MVAAGAILALGAMRSAEAIALSPKSGLTGSSITNGRRCKGLGRDGARRRGGAYPEPHGWAG